MDQIERIKKMETILDESQESVNSMHKALDNYEKTQSGLKELKEYYASELWKRDFEDDEDGKLPQDLKRGVLSEDAVYDLLLDNDDLAERIDAISEANKDKTVPKDFLYEIGNINGILETASFLSEQIGASYAIAYGFNNADLATDITQFSETDFDSAVLEPEETTLHAILYNWFGYEGLGEIMESTVSTPDVIYAFKDKTYFERWTDRDVSWTPFSCIEDGFIAVFGNLAMLFLLGNNE